jgi:lysophospholipase L1-like esterase
MRLAWTRRRHWLAAVALHLATLSACAQDKGGTATDPATRDEGGAWMELHRSFLERAGRGDFDLLFLGDSITQGWHDNEVWRRYYAPRRAANFGIGGDRTQHVLWRLDHGEVDGIKPRVVVLMIGTNNLGSNTPEEVYEGVKAIVGRLRSKLPDSRILLLGIFPRGADRDPHQVSAAADPRPAVVNRRLATLADGKAVVYLDIGDRFLDEKGRITKAIMPDFLHLSTRGYRIWADAMEPTLWEMMEGKP